MNEELITFCLSTFNTLNYLKLAIQSTRENSYYKDAPFIVHAENCTDGTNEWLEEVQDEYNLTLIIEKNNPVPRGIGGGMNICASVVRTKYIGFLSSDFYMAKDWDKELVRLQEDYPEKRLWTFSYRVEPDIFGHQNSRPGTLILPGETFGEYHDTFDAKLFKEWAEEFSATNSLEIRKPEGVSGVVTKYDWDFIGGNDDRFAPAYWEDADIFNRMLIEGFDFIISTKSVLYHFASRSSRFPDDNFKARPKHLADIEQNSLNEFVKKYGKLPTLDDVGCPIPMKPVDGSPIRINQ